MTNKLKPGLSQGLLITVAIFSFCLKKIFTHAGVFLRNEYIAWFYHSHTAVPVNKKKTHVSGMKRLEPLKWSMFCIKYNSSTCL